MAGRDFYLGPWKSKASRLEYDRLIAEWLAAGRRLPESDQDLNTTQVIRLYLRFAKGHYQKNGQPTGELDYVRLALRPLRQLYGHSRARDFGPLSLKAIQAHLVEQGLSRGGINGRIARIKRVFRWAVSEELIPPSIIHGLSAVPALKRGRSEARETDPVAPVVHATVDATLPHLSPVVADMVRFQLLTGCRPGEVCGIRPGDIDTTRDVWEHRPADHKTEHHGRERVVFIGPRAQDILRPYLLRPADTYCFSPAESERARRAAQGDRRVTPLSSGNRPGSKQTIKSRRPAGNHYSVISYRRAIHRACDRAFDPPGSLARRDGESERKWRDRLTDAQNGELKDWQARQRWSPNQLRHSAATDIRKRFGLEAAQVTLGHATADVTQVYAERDYAKAATIMREIG